jgi:hypothetical protein
MCNRVAKVVEFQENLVAEGRYKFCAYHFWIKKHQKFKFGRNSCLGR